MYWRRIGVPTLSLWHIIEVVDALLNQSLAVYVQLLVECHEVLGHFLLLIAELVSKLIDPSSLSVLRSPAGEHVLLLLCSYPSYLKSIDEIQLRLGRIV